MLQNKYFSIQVWDANNNQLLYSSGIGDYPVTAISWCPSGNYFAIGSFNTIKLCDKNGVRLINNF